MIRFTTARPFLFVGLGLLACAPPALSAPPQERHGVDVTTIDRSVQPADAFYRYANGGWLAHTVQPADQPYWGAFTEVDERNKALLRQLVEAAANDRTATPATPRGKVGLFYRVGMDEARAERLGAAPLAPLFAQINAVTDAGSLTEEIARLRRLGIGAGFAISAGQDDKDSARIIVQMTQGGIGLPTRDYYTNEDEKSKALRAQYVTHIARIFALLGDTPDAAKTNADAVLAFETRLARASLTPVQMRDPNALYHKMTLGELQSLAPQIDWKRYFTALGKPEPGDINVSMPDFVREVGKMTAEVPLDQWKTYLRWRTAYSYDNALNQAFVDESFRFGAALTGQKEVAARWKRVLNTTNGVMGEAVGQLYVAKAFPPDAKRRALALVKNLQSALRDRIQTLDWMGPDTKTQALRKLDKMLIKVGYPDKWRDYSALAVEDDSFPQNLMRAAEFEFQRELNKIGKPVDRTEWAMTPPEVNAYYNPGFNEIVFPAGILQPPFFDPKADDASNYGGIGMVIGHEMTHGFDDQGRQYDADGNLKDWWTAEDAKRFKERSSALVAQYGAYTALDDPKAPLKVNGELTQGENIADLGGLKVAYLAFHKTPQGKSGESAAPPKRDGYTPDQRFFLAYAQIWRWKISPQLLRLLVGADPHSPAEWRVYGPLVNFPPFTDAFGKPADSVSVKPGSGSVSIW